MYKYQWTHTLLFLALIALTFSCGKHYTPKPEGYLRVIYPEKAYQRFEDADPFSFEYPLYAKVEPSHSNNAEPYWYNIQFPVFNGTIHLSYKSLKTNNVESLIKDSRILVYKHTSRSDGIFEDPIVDTVKRHYGIIYDLEGNVASAVQFFLTDSLNHFLRGSLYFNTTPNRDSLNPVIDFVRKDIVHLIESVQWE